MTDQIKWIEESLLSALGYLPKSLVVSLQFYVTTALTENGPAQWDEESSSSTENVIVVAGKTNSTTSFESGSRLFELPFVKLEQGRPDLTTLIKEEIKNGMGSLSINGKTPFCAYPFWPFSF